ncbi:MAG: hypothetical protein ACREQ5_27230 [Candidatus Dormibacteria bacterium]
MSRRHVSADEPGCTWEYGWDPQRETFFARLLAGGDPESPELAGFGTRVREIGSPDALMYLMGIRLPAERVAMLEEDRSTDSEEVEGRSHRGLRRRASAPLGLIVTRERTFPRRTLITS